MDFPHIHSCLQLSSENEQLTKKVHRLKQEKRDLLKRLEVFEEQNRVAKLLKDYVTSRDVYVQTEPCRSASSSGYGQAKRAEEKSVASAELEKTNKLLSMHSQLMKRYEKEVKSNIAHVETISSLNFQILELERSCKDKEEELSQLKQVKATKDKSKGSRLSCGCQHDKKPQDETKDELKKLKKQCEKYALQNQKLKSELKGLDLGFFEEVEDIKFALRQSAKLNREYEKALRRVCAQFAVPYPNPEKILDVT